MHEDKNKTGPYTTAYAEGWDLIYGKKEEKMGPDTPVQDPNGNILPADCGHPEWRGVKPARPRKDNDEHSECWSEFPDQKTSRFNPERKRRDRYRRDNERHGRATPDDSVPDVGC